jgi:L-2,4-diaminobutyrate decarboxylase
LRLFELSRKNHPSTNQTEKLRISQMSQDVRDLLRMKGLLVSMTHMYSGDCNNRDYFHYEDTLNHVRYGFPSPVSDSAKDAYFIQAINKSLVNVNHLKSSIPYWGERGKLNIDMARNSKLPESMSTMEEVINDLCGYLQGTLNWGHPRVQKNVIPPASTLSIIGHMLGAVANANLISDELCHRFAEAELEVVSMCAELIGYDQQKAGGFFTFGGTATNLYAVKLGIEKALPGAFKEGIRQDVKVISSDVAHYSNLTALGWLGLGTKNLESVPSDKDNSMNLQALEKKAHTLIQQGGKIACIIVTMGTTDAFGIDNLDYVVKLREQLVQTYNLPYKPHIHADAVIGWAFSFFKDYDFDNNPMGFSARTLQSLADTSNKLKSLHLADSVGFDFHKTGYGPYASSLLICRNHTDLTFLARDAKDMPYLFHDGHYHPGQFTLETSRSASPALATLANLKFFGKDGYRAILGHIVNMAGKLRSNIERTTYACIVNDYNYGPVTLFRVYPDGIDAKSIYEKEVNEHLFEPTLKAHNDYNRQIFSVLQDQLTKGYGLSLSMTERYRMSANGHPIVAIKSYIVSPFVDAEVMEKLFSCLNEARGVIREMERKTSYGV